MIIKHLHGAMHVGSVDGGGVTISAMVLITPGEECSGWVFERRGLNRRNGTFHHASEPDQLCRKLMREVSLRIGRVEPVELRLSAQQGRPTR